jgi:hypothetical protein
MKRLSVKFLSFVIAIAIFSKVTFLNYLPEAKAASLKEEAAFVRESEQIIPRFRTVLLSTQNTALELSASVMQGVKDFFSSFFGRTPEVIPPTTEANPPKDTPVARQEDIIYTGGPVPIPPVPEKIINRILSGVSTEYLEQRLAQLKADIDSVRTIASSRSSSGGSSESISSRQIDNIYENMNDSIDESIFGGGADFNGNTLTIAGNGTFGGTVTATSFVGDGSLLTGIASGGISTSTLNSLSPIILGFGNAAAGTTASAIGYCNSAAGATSTASGYCNVACGINSVVFGRSNFICTAGFASVALGVLNNSTGGTLNQTTGVITGVPVASSTIGRLSTAVGVCNTTGGILSSAFGYKNTASGICSSASGYKNCALSNYSSAFGHLNTTSNCNSSAFGKNNIASGLQSSAFGAVNTASGYSSSVFGYGNCAYCTSSSALGVLNSACCHYSTASGYKNTASGYRSAAFGTCNSVSSGYSSALGYLNNVSGECSAAFGFCNTASCGSSAAFGFLNSATGLCSSAFGACNGACGYSSSAIGYGNCACSEYSSAFGSCVWNDVCCSTAIGIGSNFMRIENNGYACFSSGACIDSSGVGYFPSDRNLKENFTELDSSQILASINNLPITKWNYKAQDPSVTHIGPVAQDFFAAFSLGGSDKSISSIDPAGVALLGIQALSKQQTSTSLAISDLKLRLTDLESLMASSTSPFSTPSSFIAELQSFGASIVDGIVHFGEVVIHKLRIDQLIVGSSDAPRGITVYDKVTGEAYCIEVVNGSIQNTPGDCDTPPPDPIDPIDPVDPDPNTEEDDSGDVGTTTPEPIPEPEVVPEPEPAPEPEPTPEPEPEVTI